MNNLIRWDSNPHTNISNKLYNVLPGFALSLIRLPTSLLCQFGYVLKVIRATGLGNP